MLKKVLLFILISSVVYSQQENLPLLNLQNEKYNQSLEKLYQSRSIITNTVPQVLESELDADLYIVGPGDIFTVNVLGDVENKYVCQVYPEGEMIIPSVDKFKVSGLSLKATKELLRKALTSNYLKADVAINLTGLRKFRVYYTGEVKAPGTYFAQGSDRLSDIIEVSQVASRRIISEKEQMEVNTSLSDWSDDTRIEIHHTDGTSNTFDITKFYKLGDKSQNPYLQGGDVIYVPPVNLTDSLVMIEGNVEYQGVYQLKDQENLLDFLGRVSALNRKSNLKKVILERDNKQQSIDLIDNSDKFRTLKLKHKDKIIIPALYENVYVRGEVYLPGAFPYNANYTARDYIGQAGATDDADDVSEALVYRQATGEILSGGDIIIYKGDTIVVPKRPREVMKDYITILAPVLYLGVNIYYIVTR